MKIFVAGATGAIGPPLIAELIRRGHTVTGMSRSDAGAKSLTELGATIATADAVTNLPCETLCDSPRPRSSSINSRRCRKILHNLARHFPATGSCGWRPVVTCYALPRQQAACADTFNS